MSRCLAPQSRRGPIVGGLQIVHADYDNNSYADVLVLRGGWWEDDGLHPNSRLHSNGNGTFADVTEQVGLLTFHPTQTAAWGYYDNDGWLDLFVGNESYGGRIHRCELFHSNGRAATACRPRNGSVLQWQRSGSTAASPAFWGGNPHDAVVRFALGRIYIKLTASSPSPIGSPVS